MKKIHIILVVLFAFAVLTCTSGVASAYLRIQYVGNTMVDLSWSEPVTTDFSKYELYRDGSLIETIKDRTTTFYRDEGLTKGHTYNYEIRGTYGHRTTSATTGKVYGTITRDTVWTMASSPYDLAVSSPYDLPIGTVFVRNGANLTIEKGVMVTGTAVEEGYLGVSKKGKGALYAEGVSFYDIGVKMVSVVSGHAEIKNCFFEGERIYLRNSNNNVITGNTVSNNTNSGIFLYSSCNNTLTDNTASNNTDGISLWNSNNNVITGNTASNNTNYGISLYSSCNNTLTDNTASNNTYHGIFLSIVLTSPSCNNNTLTDNTVANNAHSGIYLYFSSNNSLMDNTVNDNKYGISLSSSSDNLIYNNYFNNTNNAYDNGKNTWHDPTGGPNIVGGPYIGGNYWSDYKGTDTSGDMLGDTELPYNCSGGIKNGGDNHPLITIRSYIVTIANKQVGEHYLWGAEGQIPDDGGGEVIMATPYDDLFVGMIANHTAQETTEGNHYCSGRHSEVTGLPHGDPDNATHQADYRKYSWLRYDWRCKDLVYGEACEGHRHFDCSGLVYFVYKQAGVLLDRTTAEGYAEMDTNIDRTDLKPGDVCYRGTPEKHIGIYVGGNQITHAAGHDKGVITTPLDNSWDGFGRLLPPELDP
jgi:parallel beta-helix repeat protein